MIHNLRAPQLCVDHNRSDHGDQAGKYADRQKVQEVNSLLQEQFDQKNGTEYDAGLESEDEHAERTGNDQVGELLSQPEAKAEYDQQQGERVGQGAWRVEDEVKLGTGDNDEQAVDVVAKLATEHCKYEQNGQIETNQYLKEDVAFGDQFEWQAHQREDERRNESPRYDACTEKWI